MSEGSTLRIRILSRNCMAILIAWIFFGGIAKAVDLTSQASIVEAAAMIPSTDDLSLAATLAAEATKRADLDEQRLGYVDWAPLSKLWCEAVLIVPDPTNLIWCAHARFGTIKQSSNPQPSLDDAIVQQARASLILIRAGLEIAGGRAEVPPKLRSQLVAQATCLRAIINDKDAPSDCTPGPHDE